ALVALAACVPLTWIAVKSPEASALMVLAEVLLALVVYGIRRREKIDNMWDRSMLGLPKGDIERWYAKLWFWWVVVGCCFGLIYWRFW
ncbi:MAG: hypothetical protein N3B12_09070, partial [Armatimonadetes bacterium]|nr:hypothetical protein [Armatimonadota bacterium]